MKLRVATGNYQPDRYLRNGGLNELYKTDQLLVQGSGDVLEILLQGGRKAFLAGHVIGARISNDTIQTNPDLKTLIDNNNIEKCHDILEGRYILIVVGRDGECDICADRFSQRDVYYRQDGKTAEFVSDLDLLTQSPAQKGYDQPALVHMLTVYGYRPPKGRTIYNGVFRLKIGEIASIKKGEVSIKTVPFKPVSTQAYGDKDLNKYAALFLDAVKVRGSQNGNVVYLSSGWDSTAILAALVHAFGAGKIRTVIGRMRYSERSGTINPFELERAKAVADYYKVPLEVVDFDFCREIPHVWDKLKAELKAHNISSLNCFSHGILADFVARTTKGGESVFAGEISDGAHNLGFSQFVSIFHPVLEFREYSDKMASYMFGPTFHGLFLNDKYHDDLIYKIFRERSGKAFFDEPAKDSVKRTEQLMAGLLLRANRVPLWSMLNNKMLSENGVACYNKDIESVYLKEAAESVVRDSSTIYSWYLHLYNSFHWQGSTVATLPLTADVNGFNIALPFWDSRLQNFLSAMPENWGRGLDLNPTKYPLKWMLKNRIDYPMHLQVGPHSYLYDVNHTFSHAAETLFASAFAPHFKKLLRQRGYKNLLSEQIFNMPYIDRLVDQYVDGSEMRGAELNDLMAMCVFSMVGWYGA